MPKTFPIMIEVEEIAVGKVMRQLNKMPGVAKLHLNMEPPSKKANGISQPPYKKFDQKAEEFILELLGKSQPTPTRVLRDHFADVGRRPGSTSSALNLLKKDGLIKPDDDNAWVLTKKAKDRLRHKKKGR